MSTRLFAVLANACAAGNNAGMDMDKTLRDIALLAARLALGGSIAAHGAQKLFGSFGGPGPEKAAQMMHSLGFRPGERVATMASAAELTSGALIMSGALGPIGPAMLTTVMLVAIETVHRPKGYWASGGGYEMNVMYLSIALLLATHGYGTLSLDHLAGIESKKRPLFGWLAIAGGVAASVAMLAQRESQTQAQSSSNGVASAERAGSPA
jgi:putative oxidoreductase